MKGKMTVRFNEKRELTLTLEHECGERITMIPFLGSCVMEPEDVLSVDFEGDNLSVGPFAIPARADYAAI